MPTAYRRYRSTCHSLTLHLFSGGRLLQLRRHRLRGDGEELGLAGVFAILLLYMVFVARGIRIGVAGQDDFGKLLATGLAFTIALQVFIMVGGVTRVIPVTGLTTPFLAAGGSSLVANWIIVALLLRISDAVRSRPRAVIG